jgi:hypothetical protein
MYTLHRILYEQRDRSNVPVGSIKIGTAQTWGGAMESPSCDFIMVQAHQFPPGSGKRE